MRISASCGSVNSVMDRTFAPGEIDWLHVDHGQIGNTDIHVMDTWMLFARWEEVTGHSKQIHM